jgi:hypothetical protein
MRTVIIRLPGEDFPTAIVRMREWLDANECEPTGYRYDQNEDMVVMSVEFAVHSHAGAFARRFDGKSGPPGDSPRSLSGDSRGQCPASSIRRRSGKPFLTRLKVSSGRTYPAFNRLTSQRSCAGGSEFPRNVEATPSSANCARSFTTARRSC